MAPRRRIAGLLSAALFVATVAFAATPTPTPGPAPTPPATTSPPPTGTEPDAPMAAAYAMLTLCQIKTTGEVCCTGKAKWVGPEDAVVRVDGAAQCQTVANAKPILISGELTVKPVNGELDFTDACTKPPASTDCPASIAEGDYVFSDIVQVTIDQPKGEPLFSVPGVGVVFP
jgi:hypothetical protein